jgi:hypothetical protein
VVHTFAVMQVVGLRIVACGVARRVREGAVAYLLLIVGTLLGLCVHWHWEGTCVGQRYRRIVVYNSVVYHTERKGKRGTMGEEYRKEARYGSVKRVGSGPVHWVLDAPKIRCVASTFASL